MPSSLSAGEGGRGGAGDWTWGQGTHTPLGCPRLPHPGHASVRSGAVYTKICSTRRTPGRLHRRSRGRVGKVYARHPHRYGSMKRDFLGVLDAEKDFVAIRELATTLKNRARAGEHYEPLRNKTLALIFEKASTRTRVSFEVAMSQLGGHAL